LDLAFRLHANLCKPSSNRSWWPSGPIKPYAEVNNIAALVLRQINRAQDPEAEASSCGHLIYMVRYELLPQLPFIFDFENEFAYSASTLAVYASEPPKTFAVGPNGLEVVIHVLYYFRRFIIGSLCNLAVSEVKKWRETVDVHGRAICAALIHFRSLVHREFYDPPEFINIRRILRTRANIFPEASENDRLEVLRLNIFDDHPDLFAGLLMEDFALDSKGTFSEDGLLRVGEHGLEGFMAMVDTILDVLPIAHESY
ncbi:hypothetical protein R3P38DRAFT_2354480, partial [Favolaschia claudopus]